MELCGDAAQLGPFSTKNLTGVAGVFVVAFFV